MNYKIGFWIALISLVMVGVVMVVDTPKTPVLTETEDIRTDYLDTIFSMQTRSADAIVMQFDIEASIMDTRDVDHLKVIIYEASLRHGALTLYESVTMGKINDLIVLPNAEIISMSFEEYFMNLLYANDTIPSCVDPTLPNLPLEDNFPKSVKK